MADPPQQKMERDVVTEQASHQQSGEDNHDGFIEHGFDAIGRLMARRPWTAILLSILVSVGCGYGWAVLKTENRPDKQWVPIGAAALEHAEYVKNTWPSSSRFAFYIAKCKGDGCNILEAKYIKRLNEIHKKIMSIEVDGALLPAPAEEPDRYTGNWSFRGGGPGKRAKCGKFGPFCGQQSVLDIFKQDDAIIENLTNVDAMRAFNFWEKQENLCVVTIAREDSPCINATIWEPNANANDCMTYDTTAQRASCRNASTHYCNAICPTRCTPFAPGDCVPQVVPGRTCGDLGCLSLQVFENFGNTASNSATTNNETDDGRAPDSAFAWSPFELKSVVSASSDGPVMDSNGKVVSATTFFGFYVLAQQTMVQGGSEFDPVAEKWEEEALCALGIKAEARSKRVDCVPDDLMEITAQFTRSLGDEFGPAITGDLAYLGFSYIGLLAYLVIMLSKRDSVHSMLGMSCVVLLAVLLSYSNALGLGGLFGLFNNSLNNNIPFLLLGLGVDDAFVLSSEFTRATKARPYASIEERIGMTLRHGGVSVLITSVTDALAFLVGSVTVLPALSWFCRFAGLGVIFCFIFQITVFIPALAINAKRAEANRLDCCCCIKSTAEHSFEDPKGCCLCCTAKAGMLERILGRFGRLVTKGAGAAVSLIIFAAITGGGAYGCTKIYKDFKLEWFVPGDSYLQDFYSYNEAYFQGGVPFTVYTPALDYFSKQQTVEELFSMVNASNLVMHTDPITSWHHEFLETIRGNAQSAASQGLDTSVARSKALFTNNTMYYTLLLDWLKEGGGARYRTSISWVDANCDSDNETVWQSCRPLDGVKAGKFSATLTLEATISGTARYASMDTLRRQIDDKIPGAFPYSFQFTYWEEVGIIDGELTTNLLICGGVIAVLIGLMIPHPRIAFFVVICILLSIFDLIGFMYFWGVTISSISAIYILLAVGLAVDYSAHIAHMFVVSTGSSNERAVAALQRIGPSVFNAVVSTMIAVLVMGFSKSYIFAVFFKAFFLTVLFGGAHGLWLLPVMLSLFGGSRNVVPGVSHKSSGATVAPV